jgi:hypothetical protein
LHELSEEEGVMLAVSHAILSVSSRTRELSESTILNKKATQHLRELLASRVGSKHASRHGK